MRTLATLTVCAFLVAACASPRIEVETSTDGQTITKTFSESGELVSVARHEADGSPVGTLFYDDGKPSYAEMYDGDLLAGRIFYFPNGNPRREERYDAEGSLRASRDFSAAGEVTGSETFDPGVARPTEPPS